MAGTRSRGVWRVLAKYSDDELRDDHGRWTSGGASTGGGFAFVSPNVRENTKLRDAVRNLGGHRTNKLIQISRHVDQAFGTKAREVSKAVGAWQDGAEETTIQRFPESVSYEDGAAAAAAKGYLAQQKAVLWFKAQPGGTNRLYEFAVRGSDLAHTHTALLQHGVEFHTLVTERGSTRVFVYDEAGTAGESVQKAAGALGATHVISRQGKGEFIGSWNTRQEGAQQFEQRIRQWEAAAPGRSGRWDGLRADRRLTVKQAEGHQGLVQLGEIAKQPDVSDVHQATNLGNARRRRGRTGMDTPMSIMATRLYRKHREAVGKPYASVRSLPAAVRSNVKAPKRRRQFRDVFNSIRARTGSDSRAFAGAYSASRKSAVPWQIDVDLIATEKQGDERLIFGWASVIEKDGQPVIDLQDDIITEADLEKAFYGFAEHHGIASDSHGDRGSHIGKMVELCVFTKAKQQALGIDLGQVGAWVGFRVSPDIFAKVKSGEYSALSLGGSGRRVALE